MADCLYRFRRWREKKRKCKANHHNCSECIYGEHHFEGAVFRGTSCRMEKKVLTSDAAPQWISVKERLPEEDDNTETWYESSGGMRAITVIVYDGRSVLPANRFRASTGEPYEWSISAKNATHWMPLPEPPKEEENG